MTKRGYVYKAWITENNYDVLGSDAEMAVVEDPDDDTLSDGSHTSATELQLTWNQYTLKLKLECVVQTKAIVYSQS